MTVTLAFKAFAKAIPCLTPFFATSDPSVLKRILAYIRGLPCSSNIFPKKVIVTYMVRRRCRSMRFYFGSQCHAHDLAEGRGPVTHARIGVCGRESGSWTNSPMM